MCSRIVKGANYKAPCYWASSHKGRPAGDLFARTCLLLSLARRLFDNATHRRTDTQIRRPDTALGPGEQLSTCWRGRLVVVVVSAPVHFRSLSLSARLISAVQLELASQCLGARAQANAKTSRCIISLARAPLQPPFAGIWRPPSRVAANNRPVPSLEPANLFAGAASWWRNQAEQM